MAKEVNQGIQSINSNNDGDDIHKENVQKLK